jgi:hypothetical protein
MPLMLVCQVLFHHACVPRSFEVKQSDMELEECVALKLPFVDNQVDFAFYTNCSACDEGATLREIKQEIIGTTKPLTTTTTTATTTITGTVASTTAPILTTHDPSAGQSSNGATSPPTNTAVIVLGVLFAVVVVVCGGWNWKLRSAVQALQVAGQQERGLGADRTPMVTNPLALAALQAEARQECGRADDILSSLQAEARRERERATPAARASGGGPSSEAYAVATQA